MYWEPKDHDELHLGEPAAFKTYPPTTSQDCLVPRLTLLFFGEAKNIPEAAKTVTAGTACVMFRTVRTRPCFSSHATTPEEVDHQRNRRDDQQKVNEPTGNVECEKPQQPQNQQNKKQR
jgi:hypothetical protein